MIVLLLLLLLFRISFRRFVKWWNGLCVCPFVTAFRWRQSIHTICWLVLFELLIFKTLFTSKLTWTPMTTCCSFQIDLTVLGVTYTLSFIFNNTLITGHFFIIITSFSLLIILLIIPVVIFNLLLITFFKSFNLLVFTRLASSFLQILLGCLLTRIWIKMRIIIEIL